jgi:hypothetical protein
MSFSGFSVRCCRLVFFAVFLFWRDNNSRNFFSLACSYWEVSFRFGIVFFDIHFLFLTYLSFAIVIVLELLIRILPSPFL